MTDLTVGAVMHVGQASLRLVSRLAEMQLQILWEEIMQRFRLVEVVGAPVRVRSNFVKGFTELPVQAHLWS